jgi:hypothetical protein
MICSTCSQYGLVPIWYGMPTSNEIFLAREDKLVLGGTKEKGYNYFCLYCQEPEVV